MSDKGDDDDTVAANYGPPEAGYGDMFAERADCALNIALRMHLVVEEGPRASLQRMLDALVGQVEPVGVNRRAGAGKVSVLSGGKSE